MFYEWIGMVAHPYETDVDISSEIKVFPWFCRSDVNSTCTMLKLYGKPWSTTFFYSSHYSVESTSRP